MRVRAVFVFFASLGITIWLSAAFVDAAQCAEVTASSLTPKQGQTIEISVSGLDSLSDTASTTHDAAPPLVKFNGNSYKLFPFADNKIYKSLVAIPADLKPGHYQLSVDTEKLDLNVLDGRFPLQHIALPPGKDNFLMSPGEKETVDRAKAVVSDQRFWHGAFVPPSKYRISALFGLKRAVNGKILDDYFHSGLDFAAPLGSPIVACADGKIVLAHKGYRLHGNIVAVDHGQGVVSFYLHMNTIAVKLGQSVKGGEKLGTVGQTGRANGPHLHYSVYVNQVATNPQNWFKRAF